METKDKNQTKKDNKVLFVILGICGAILLCICACGILGFLNYSIFSVNKVNNSENFNNSNLEGVPCTGKAEGSMEIIVGRKSTINDICFAEDGRVLKE
jgi:hypothetical protein